MIDQRIPDLSDKELENLHGNAIRLAQSGTPVQKVEAERLLPIIGAEVDARTRAKAAAAQAKREEKRVSAAAARKAVASGGRRNSKRPKAS